MVEDLEVCFPLAKSEESNNSNQATVFTKFNILLNELKLFGENIKHLCLPHFNLGDKVEELKILKKLESLKIMMCNSIWELLLFLENLPEDNKLKSFTLLDTYPFQD